MHPRLSTKYPFLVSGKLPYGPRSAAQDLKAVILSGLFCRQKFSYPFPLTTFQINRLTWSYGLNSVLNVSLLYPVTNEIQTVQPLGLPEKPLLGILIKQIILKEY